MEGVIGKVVPIGLQKHFFYFGIIHTKNFIKKGILHLYPVLAANGPPAWHGDSFCIEHKTIHIKNKNLWSVHIVPPSINANNLWLLPEVVFLAVAFYSSEPIGISARE